MRDAKRRRGKTLLAAVGLGMALFVFGFVMTVTSLSAPEAVSSGDSAFETYDASPDGASLQLLMGLFASLGGIVLATAGPAMMLMRARKGLA